MTVLLSVVGMRDPDGDDSSEGSIITVARHLKPQHVRLLPTRGRRPEVGTEANAQRTETRLREVLPGVEVRMHPLTLDDPTDYNAIGRVLQHVIYEALYGLEGEELHCAISPGTPQLRMLLMLLLREKVQHVRFWEARAPQYATDDRPRVQELNLTFLDQPDLAARFAQAWQIYDFAGASLLLRERMDRQPLSPARPRWEWVMALADAYARWDAVDWGEARDGLARVRMQAATAGVTAPFRVRLEQQEVAVARLVAAQATKLEDYLTMVDLYWNARRRLAARQYVDALARWRRVLEGSLTAAVRGMDGCGVDERGRLTVSTTIEPAWQAFRTKQWGASAWPPVGSANLDDLICVVRAGGQLPAKLSNAVGGAQQARNKSIAAHGMEPVSEPVVAGALKQLDDLLAALFPNDAVREPVAGYPFGTDALDALGRDLMPLLNGVG